MVGVPFRPQGHDPATGLDCVGLVWAAYAAAGRRLVRPMGYPLRGWARARIEAALVERGVILRPMGGYGLGDCLRITVGTENDNARLLAALDEVLA